MPSHTIDALFQALKKGETARVYYLYGVEDVLKDDAVRTILDGVLEPGLRELNLDQRSAAQLDAEEIHALCNTLPMMADRRVVVIREVEGWKRKTKGRTEFLKYAEHPSSETVVVLVQGSSEESEDKELSRLAYAVRFDQLPAERARKWVAHRATSLGLSLEPDAADHLVQAMGADLGPLASELAKLASLPDNTPVTTERIGDLIGVHRGETTWDWREAVFSGKTGQAVTLLPSLLAQPGVSAVKLVSLLGTSLIGVGIARTRYDQGLRSRALNDAVFQSMLKIRPPGLPPYKEEAPRWARWASEWPITRVRSALRAARATDEALKNTTLSDDRGLVADLVLRMTIASAAAA
jgi:DNA polymerase III subunit delta